MTSVVSKFSVILLAWSWCLASFGANSPQMEEQQLQVAIRMIGHEFLMQQGDLTSRVLPIQKNGDRYLISFERSISFDPGELMDIVDRVLLESNLATNLLVETELCHSPEVVHSFVMGRSANPLFQPCSGRLLPEDCYHLYITLLDPPLLTDESQQSTPNSEFDALAHSAPSTTSYWLLFGLLGCVGGTLIFFRKKPAAPKVDPDQIALGAFQFNPKSMILSIQNEQVQLSHKETELLSLLYQHAQEPVAREVLLQGVWGDEGDYIGRTLDVFVSKLRKKLEADPNVRIVNIRGVGYRLVIDPSEA